MFALTVFVCILAGIIGIGVLALPGSFVLQLCLKLVAKRTAEPERAFVSMFVVYLACTVVGLILGSLLSISGPYGEAFTMPVYVLSVPIGLGISVAVIAPRHALDVGEAVLVAILMNVIWIAIGAIGFGGWVVASWFLNAIRVYING